MNLSLIEKLIESKNADCLPTKILLKEYFQNFEELNLFQSSVKAENSVVNFIDEVQKRMQFDAALNILPLFKYVDANVTRVDLQFFTLLRIFEQLGTITWQEFEDFCGVMMRKCFSATEVHVTQRTGDGGVDFEGKIPFKSAEVTTPYGWIEYFGQAKQYSGSVPRSDIDAFIAYASKKKRDYEYPAQLFIFCASSDFNSNALKEIRKNNFIGLNGMQLATLVFLHSDKNVPNKNFVIEFMQS